MEVGLQFTYIWYLQLLHFLAETRIPSKWGKTKLQLISTFSFSPFIIRGNGYKKPFLMKLQRGGGIDRQKGDRTNKSETNMFPIYDIDVLNLNVLSI